MKPSSRTDSSEPHAPLPLKSPPSIPFWMWAAVAALLIFAVYVSWEALQVKKSIEATNAQAAAEVAKHRELEETLALAQREATILTDPRSVKISLGSENKNMPKLEAAWHGELGIVISGKNVAAPSGTHILQLWLIPKATGSKPIPSLAARPDADGKFTLFVANPQVAIEATKALTITQEPAGGSQAPTTKPLWVGAIGQPGLIAKRHNRMRD